MIMQLEAGDKDGHISKSSQVIQASNYNVCMYHHLTLCFFSSMVAINSSQHLWHHGGFFCFQFPFVSIQMHMGCCYPSLDRVLLLNLDDLCSGNGSKFLLS